jgi:hypothetical protein
MEDDLNGRQPQWKMTSMEDDPNSSNQENLHENNCSFTLVKRKPNWKMEILKIIGR